MPEKGKKEEEKPNSLLQAERKRRGTALGRGRGRQRREGGRGVLEAGEREGGGG